ncbi:thiolase family protein [Bacillus sp. CGMCC 1.16541]|uniref:thiolase family protein n=1 Tax=Bacillus sp. CGMCC 1.16541 TaxID=2185143 RepID=UPI000D729B20|nr:thiolase family protein [Bacillus sp. CGMCC 1.16541]
MREAVIVAAKRTAVGKIGGMFKDVPPEELAATLIRQIILDYQLHPSSIDEVVLGNAVGPGGNIARLSALQAGLPVTVPGVTIDRQCGSGLEAINIAMRFVQSGAIDVVLAGGVESSSLAPWKLAKPTSLYHPGGPNLVTRARFSPDCIGDPDMGVAAENVAKQFHISRDDQDTYALHSHQKAIHAQQTRRFEMEIVSVNGMIRDECPREQTSKEKLAKLQPVFQQGGTVTAGNACPINDGAALVLIMSAEKCIELNLTPIATLVDATSAGVDPNILGVGPIPAVQKLLERTNLSISDIDVFEFNEAFASQVLASIRALHIPEEKLNLGGGALAIGHPYGASGAILITRLCTEMQRTGAKRGLATLGIGGGLGVATLLERK